MALRVVQAKDIIWRKIGDEVVVIKDDGLSTHVLNKTAAVIWEMCERDRALEEIAQGLSERFEVSYEQAVTDVNETVEKLLQVSIMNQVGDVV
jgi:hypothetical protein